MTTAESVVHRLIEVADKDPSRVALAFGDEQTSYGQLREIVERTAAGLAGLGVGRGDRVALMLGNCPQYFITSMAIWRAGAVQVPINSALRQHETRHILADSGAKVVLVSPATADIVGEVRGELPELTRVVVVGEDGHAAADLSFDELSAATAEPAALADDFADAVAVIAYTSGTTGRPKGAMLGHRHLVDNLSIGQAHLGLTEDDPVLQGLPAFHNNASFNGVFLAWWCGSKAVLLERFAPDALVAKIAEHRVAFLVAVATILYDIARLPEDAGVDFSSVRYVVFGGSPTPPPIRKAVEDRFGLRMIQAYGMTEAQYIALDPTEGEIVQDGSGIPCVHNQLSLLNASGEPVASGEVGEICLSQPEQGDAAGRKFRPILGYWNNPAETEKAFAGGVFHTGDLGRLDDKGFLHVVDRLKDMIIRGGTNIYPAELERALTDDPRVAEAYVVAKPDDRLGEVPKAFVVLADGAEVEPEQLRSEINDRIARYKRIEEIQLLTHDEVPRNAMGKVLKRELRTR